MLTLAGYPLPIVTEEIRALLRRNICQDRVAEQLFGLGRSWPGFGTVGLATPTTFRPWPPPVGIGDFWYPCGASHFAVGYFLVDVDTLNGGLHDACFGSAGTLNNAVPLVLGGELDDGTITETFTLTSAFVLPPVPLYRVLKTDGTDGSDGGMFLLVVVDQRYWWGQVPVPDFAISEAGSVAWTGVFSAIGTALNLASAITVDTVNTAYLQPSRAVNLTYENIAMMLDAVAWNVGQRVVVDPLTGKVSTQNFETAQTAYEDDQNSEDGMARTVRAGGAKYLDDL